MSPKFIKIIYWVFTGLVILLLGPGAFFDAIAAPEAIKYVSDLGYPDYIVPFLGVAKLLGLIAILIPGFPTIKEWAYAGLVIDLTGALYSHIAVAKPITDWIFLFIGILIIIGSYIFYHKKTQVAASNRVALVNE